MVGLSVFSSRFASAAFVHTVVLIWYNQLHNVQYNQSYLHNW